MVVGLRALDAQVAQRTAELLRSNRELDASLSQLRDAQRRAAFLADASKQLAGSLDYDVTLQSIARSTVPELADWCSVTLLKEDGSIHQVALAHIDPEHEELARELNEKYPRRATDRHNPTSRVLQSGKSEMLSTITPDGMRSMSNDEVHFSYWHRLNPQSSVVVPMTARGRTIGALTLVRTRTGMPCGEADLQLAEELALRAAQAVDNARLYRAAQVEILERKRAEQALEYQASHDSLTELPNRAVLHEQLESALRSTQRSTDSGPALLLMDLDGFKEVNDTLGHHAGDELLKGVAGRLRSAIRGTDAAARLGGDEFGLFLPSTSAEGALQVAENILRALEEPFTIEGQQVSVGASLGLAVCPEDGSDASTLLRHADVAMYAAKHAHLGVVRYVPEQDQHNAGRLALVSELREALGRDELVLHYQPKRDLRSGRNARVEALVRWQHPVHGLLAPDAFVPLAESTGLIGLLDRWVLNAALRQSAVWRAEGLDVPVAVNLSVQDLRDRTLPDLIGGLLREHAVPVDGLILEITETGLLGDPARAFEVLQGLRALGVHIAIDDFGAGNAALGYLKHLPVDELKIDRSFVQDMRQNIGDAAIVRTTIDLAHRLGMAVVAEGVEDGATLDVLAALGCDLAQGYYISRPLDAARCEDWLRAHPGMGSLGPQVLHRAA
jgi:diguanylate cyclase (GGDEF)-like protein